MKLLHLAAFSILVVFALIGVLFTTVFIGMQFGWFNVRGGTAERNVSIATVLGAKIKTCTETCTWQNTAEWATVREGLRKDALVIQRVAGETGVPARLIATVVVPEQMRFFTSERETFKKVFEPLKILGSLSQFSLGVSGIKQDTAEEIERRVPYELASLVMYPTEHDTATLLFERLTDPKDHYYAYLYAALFIREIQDEWALAGYPINTQPGIVATLFNIGFKNSHPHASPQVGGAFISVASTTYTFGELGESFYYSDELVDVFPAQ
jgi:hypothetical protein